MNRRRKQPEAKARRKKKARFGLQSEPFKRIQVFSLLPLFHAAADLDLN
jgi:hypothetical protein